MSPIVDSAVYAAAAFLTKCLKRTENQYTDVVAQKIKSGYEQKFGSLENSAIIKNSYQGVSDKPAYHAPPCFDIFTMYKFKQFSFRIFGYGRIVRFFAFARAHRRYFRWKQVQQHKYHKYSPHNVHKIYAVLWRDNGISVKL